MTILSGGTYEPFGPLTGFNFGNGVTLAQGYDQDYELSSINAAAGGTAIQNLVYGYDPSGNILSITDNLNASLTQGFQYENLNRLWTASGPYGSQTYTYDGVGNRATVTLAGVTYTYTPSMTSNQIVSISGGGNTRSFTYFASGQTKTDQRTPTSKYSYTADGVGRLSGASLNNSSIASYTHNGFEQRVVKTVGSTVTDLIYDRAGHLLAEANHATGAMIREWMDDKPVAMVDDTGASPAIYYIHTDQVNRPQKLTDVSDNIVWDGVFDPFGNVWSIAGSETMLLMFPGQYYDSETQLSQNWHRDYDPTIGRYVQSDPIGLWGGINTYAYVGNNPLRYLDPNGMAAEKPDCSKKDDCIERCSDLALPTSDYGTAFFRCMQTCMGTNPWPEWTKYFPDADSEPAPAPGQSNSQNAAAAAVGAAAGVAVSWATIEIIAAGLALAF